ncbi:MAG: C69 family dipeptidase [Deltaproteobacteria bacterium]|uniref:Dipeptidase n=1 Tax=Candidatus Zymogenus saltonus TaxID=2844893 RepID=A0A9D8KG60_9DELT|nr:C69 family dipeptidase [Candidatus Zymogenus saltonus]
MCDTFVATGAATFDGSVIFAKNSDREPNEAQAVEYYPAKVYKKGEDLKLTYITIPQAVETRGVLLSRPFWIWGAEMGANDAGVVIGNESVFTKLPMRKEKMLLGMDLLRLGLERADTAEGALDVMAELLGRYGQGGPAGYEDKKLLYHNSFIIADPKEAWVFETADYEWAAVKVKGVRSISNRITIGNEFDRSSPGLVETAVKKGWCKSGEDFDFDRCYSDWFFSTFSMARQRCERTQEMIDGGAGKIAPPTMMSYLRDHNIDDEKYRTQKRFFMDEICMHAANGLPRASQTTGSLVSHLTGKINTHWITGTAAPCTSVFKPFYFEAGKLPDVGPEPTGRFDKSTLWWRHERLHREVIKDYPKRMKAYRDERDRLEAEFLKESEELLKGASKGKGEEFSKKLYAFSENCFKRAGEAEDKWIETVRSMPIEKKANFVYSSYWKKQSKKAGIQA